MPSAKAGPNERVRIVVAGMILAIPLGGLSWSTLQFVLGLQRLGHEVWFVEDADTREPWYYDPVRDVTDADPSYALAYTQRLFREYGLDDHWALHDKGGWQGPAADRILGVLGEADLLITRSGSHTLCPWMSEIPHRALFDSDPGFTQLTHLLCEPARRLADAHTAHFTIGESIPTSSGVPDDGLAWRPTRHPIVLDAVPVVAGPPDGSFTTVMHWDSFPAIVHDGRRYGLKSHAFAPYVVLPSGSSQRFEIAVGGSTRPPDTLAGAGWTVRNALEVTWDVAGYLRYITGSKAEFTVAKEGYVLTDSGWFSERSATYLAAGRPVLVQETGFSRHLPAGEGIVSFASPEEALAGAEDIHARYDVHCRAAREIAHEFFDARVLLSELVASALTPDPPGDAVAR